MLGLKRGTVALLSHDPQWTIEANNTILELQNLLGSLAEDIQQIGSTAIAAVHAKPILDIAVAVEDFTNLGRICEILESKGYQFFGSDLPGQYLFGYGYGDVRTHHVHFVMRNSDAWVNYINFRDFLNTFPHRAKEYNDLKLRLATQYPDDRSNYTASKQTLIGEILRDAANWRMGK